MDAQEKKIAREMMVLSGEFSVCRPVFLAMGDENRQHILLTLLEHYGGMRVGEIASCTNLSRPAVSRHLKILREARIVDMFQVGTMNFYHIGADENRWAEIAALVNHVNVLVKEAASQCSPNNVI